MCPKHLAGGDWNGHLFDPRGGLWVDAELGRLAGKLRDDGFGIFPDSADRVSYRSGMTSSTIDFVFHRNVTVQTQDIARVFIAQHKPIVCTFGGLLPSNGNNTSNMVRALGTFLPVIVFKPQMLRFLSSASFPNPDSIGSLCSLKTKIIAVKTFSMASKS